MKDVSVYEARRYILGKGGDLALVVKQLKDLDDKDVVGDPQPKDSS